MRRLLVSPFASPLGRAVLACCGFAALSVAYGQDTSWDVLNYHLYNAWAALHGRIGFDMAPAGLQSYFNPSLDIAHWWLLNHLPGPVGAALAGAYGGLSYALLERIAHATLPVETLRERPRLACWLALAGALSPQVVFGIGSGMGDLDTAIPVLAAVAVAARAWPRLARGETASARMLLAGCLAGIGAGLKLTNAPYALALAAAMLALPQPPSRRLRAAALLALGLAASIGWWWLLLLRTFGNPLFPQFSAWFAHPWTLPVGVSDRRWLPRGVWETLAWPLIFTWNGKRVGEQAYFQALWVLVYLLYLGWLARALLAMRRAREPGAADRGKPAAAPTAGSWLLLVLALSYLLWMELFSLFRYTTPIGTLLALAAWLLWSRVTPPGRGQGGLLLLIGGCTALGLLVGHKTAGHDPFSRQALRIELPPLAHPGSTTALLVDDPAPVAWLATGFPPSVMFASVGSAFPAAPGYARELRRRITRRGGPVAMIQSVQTDWRTRNVRRARTLLLRLGVLSSPLGCRVLHAIARNSHIHARIHDLPAGAPDGQLCTAEALESDRLAAEQDNRRDLDEAARRVASVGLRLEPGSCRILHAWTGSAPRPYRWCRVEPLAAPGSAEHDPGAQPLIPTSGRGDR